MNKQFILAEQRGFKDAYFGRPYGGARVYAQEAKTTSEAYDKGFRVGLSMCHYDHETGEPIKYRPWLPKWAVEAVRCMRAKLKVNQWDNYKSGLPINKPDRSLDYWTDVRLDRELDFIVEIINNKDIIDAV